MFKNIQRNSNKIIDRVKGWLNLITFYGLILFAFLATFHLMFGWLLADFLGFKRKFPSLIFCEIITLTLVFFFVSYLVYKRFPNRFLKWRLNNLIGGLFSIFLPPASNFIISVALSYFIFSLLQPGVGLMWKEGPIFSEEIFKGTAAGLIALLITLFGIGIVFYISFGLLDNILKRKFPEATWIYIVFLFINLVGVCLVMAIYSWAKSKDFDILLFKELSTKIVKFALGFIPLGWFYELFVGSIAKEKRRTSGVITSGVKI